MKTERRLKVRVQPRDLHLEFHVREGVASEQVMVSKPQTIGVDKPLAYALYMMAEGGFRHVPVVDQRGVPVGMVSARDALGQDLVDLEREIQHQQELETSIGY